MTWRRETVVQTKKPSSQVALSNTIHIQLMMFIKDHKATLGLVLRRKKNRGERIVLSLLEENTTDFENKSREALCNLISS